MYEKFWNTKSRDESDVGSGSQRKESGKKIKKERNTRKKRKKEKGKKIKKQESCLNLKNKNQTEYQEQESWLNSKTRILPGDVILDASGKIRSTWILLDVQDITFSGKILALKE